MFRAAARAMDARDASTDLSIDGQQRDRQFSLGAVSSNTNRVRKRQSRQSAFHRGESTVHDSCISYLGPAARPRDRPRFPVCARSEPIDENAHFARNVRSPPQPSFQKPPLRSTERWTSETTFEFHSQDDLPRRRRKEKRRLVRRGARHSHPGPRQRSNLPPLVQHERLPHLHLHQHHGEHVRHHPLALRLEPVPRSLDLRRARPPPPADRRSRLTSFTTASFIFAIVSALPTAR